MRSTTLNQQKTTCYRQTFLSWVPIGWLVHKSWTTLKSILFKWGLSFEDKLLLRFSYYEYILDKGNLTLEDDKRKSRMFASTTSKNFIIFDLVLVFCVFYYAKRRKIIKIFWFCYIMIKFSDSKRLLINLNLNFSDWAHWDHSKSWRKFHFSSWSTQNSHTLYRDCDTFECYSSQISWRTFECFVLFSTAGMRKNKHIIKKVNVLSQTSLMWTVRPESHARVRIRVEIQVIRFSGTAASRICP